MSIVPSRHAVVACFAVCVCAIVCGCGKQETASVPSATPAMSATNATEATSELQDWAKQATAGASDPAARAAVARVASEPLATPVIHTVD
jgi:hypothetical protein